MKGHDDQHEIVEINFEVGHVSMIRSGPPTNHNPPRTHDWKVFLRSASLDGDLNCLIERCVFHLHPSFTNNKQELKTTPFAIRGNAYAGFPLLIEIFFKTKNEPRQYSIEYDLDLHQNVEGEIYRQKMTYLRKYRCIFSNPDGDLRGKILAAGGKIVDSGPMASADDDESETNLRSSPPKKRSISPASSTHLSSTTKKIKVHSPPSNETKKKPEKTSIKTVVAPKKTATPSNTTKPLKVSLAKESKTTVENSAINKPRPSTKITKTQSSHEIKSSTSTNEVKKKENNTSPTKTKPVGNSQNVLQSSTTKKIPKLSIKLEGKSPPAPPPPSTSISFDKQKKIPKKTSLPSTSASTSTKVEKPSSSLNRTIEVPSSQKSTTKKVNAPLKRESSLPNITTTTTIKSIQRTEETSTNSKDNISSRSKESTTRPKTSIKKTISDRIVSKSVDIPSTSNSLRVEPPSQDLNVPSPAETVGSSMIPSTTNSPSVDQPMIESDQLQLSEDSNSGLGDDQMPVTTFKSDQFDLIHDSNNDDDLDDEDNDEDLPTGLTDDDLRYKLIYIYNRFRSQSIQDLNIFVRFFKRHHLIDSSALTIDSNTDNMFTYDLFCLSPSHIGELADDLGYVAPSTA